MWAGVDPDVELFASGLVLDGDGEWSGGQTLGEAGDDAGGSQAPLVGAPATPSHLSACAHTLNLPAGICECWH